MFTSGYAVGCNQRAHALCFVGINWELWLLALWTGQRLSRCIYLVGGYVSTFYIHCILVGGDWNHGILWLSIGNVILPIDELIFFGWVGQPPTRHSSQYAECPTNHDLGASQEEFLPSSRSAEIFQHETISFYGFLWQCPSEEPFQPNDTPWKLRSHVKFTENSKGFFWVQTLVSSVNVANKKTSLGTAINMFIISSGSLFILVVLICGILGSPILGRNHLVLLIISYDLSHDMYTLLYILPLITSHLELFENKFFFE